ncbi:MAG: ATP-binding protein [Acidimicrobiales bacterium]
MLECKAEFSPDPASVTGARRFVRQTLLGWDAEAWEYQASALVTELASNAVLHARTPFAVELSYDGRQLRLCVSDRSERLPLHKPHSPEATTGRGLDLVRALSASWGVDRHASGKTVWCSMGSDANALAVDEEQRL